MALRRCIQPLRRVAAKFFYNFGLHCAKNQIRVILISDLVITSLFYPALALYFSSQPFSDLSNSLQDTIFSFSSGGDHVYSAYNLDVRDVWDNTDAVRIREDAVSRCGSERTIRLERILLPGVLHDRHSTGNAVNQETLLATMDLHQRLDQLISRDGLECLQDLGPDSSSFNKCLVLGPLAHWDEDEEELRSDENVLRTLNSSRNVTKAGTAITLDMTLSGRGPVDEQGWSREAEFLVLTYFFLETDCHSNAKHLAWQQIVNEATIEMAGKAVHSKSQPKLIALQYDKDRQPTSQFPFMTVTIYMCYIIIFTYFSGALRRIDTVHSRFGLAFTGLVEIIASTITSVSVCALGGFRVTMVPWAILPVMIVFIGAEDMFILIQEVTSTPVSIPVKERIALGLSRGGTSNTFKVFAYNALFGSMAYFATGAIRQFCIFTVVVLVAHWFLIHTFFVAVLAIDIQRLELADLLHQGPRIDPSAPDRVGGEKSATDAAAVEVKSMRQFFRRERAAKNGSLLVILAITGGLYWASLPKHPSSLKAIRLPSMPKLDITLSTYPDSEAPSSYTTQENVTRLPFAPRPDGDPSAPVRSFRTAFWRTFNLDDDVLVHIRIQPPSQVTLLGPTSSSQENHDYGRQLTQRRRSIHRALRSALWTFKIVILPMSATAFALYRLLLYLLKDAELLEAQRNRAEGGSLDVDNTDLKEDLQVHQPASAPPVAILPTVDPNLTLTILPRAFLADVSLVVSSARTTVTVAITVANEAVLWRIQGSEPMEGGGAQTQMVSLSALMSGIEQKPEQMQPGFVTALAVDASGTRCALGTKTGLVVQWRLGKGLEGRTSAQCAKGTAVRSLLFLEESASTDRTRPSSTSTIKAGSNSLLFPSSKPKCTTSPSLLVSLLDGQAWLWDLKPNALPSALPTSSPPKPYPPIAFFDERDELRVMFALSTGEIEVVSVDRTSADEPPRWPRIEVIAAVAASEEIAQMYINSFLLGPDLHSLAVVVTKSGFVVVLDLTLGERICELENAVDNVSRVRLAPIPWSRCDHCGQMEPNSFLLAFSSSLTGTVDVRQAVIVTEPTRCVCAFTRVGSRRGSKVGLRERSTHIHRSRAGSTINSTSSSPSAPRTASTSTIHTPNYPISGHGYHSRRGSDKDVRPRQSLESNLSEETDFDLNFALSDPFTVSAAVPQASDSEPARRMVRVIKITEVPCDRGQWEVKGSTIVGVRRKPRGPKQTEQAPSSDKPSLPERGSSQDALFKRWELWTYSLKEDTQRASSLTDLNRSVVETNGSSSVEDGSLAESELVRRHPAIKRLVDLTSPPASKRSSSSSHSKPLQKPPQPQHPILPFTHVSFITISGFQLFLGLGNTVCIIDATYLTSPLPSIDTHPSSNMLSVPSLDKKRI
ncbi:hypothetical protein FRB95_008527 [Tulasnella sp. JGI-2019a]|nr:hypothetical protein FRB95_008527 [Tulasnella sp. JGI-2019a]